MSYVDAPPFVAYLNIVQAKLGIFQPLINRLLVVILHLIATIFLILIVKNNHVIIPSNNRDNLSDKLLITFLLAYIIPIFGLYGIFILPDSGLILGLSLMLWVSDHILREGYISIKNSLLLGIGLGIGLLSKYHILPLGGGMLLGLYLDLACRNSNQYSLRPLAMLIISVLLGLVIAAPLFIWNYTNHYASFIFQLQHGFNSNSWQLISMVGFIFGAILYLTPWFAYMLFKYGVLKERRYYILIPVFCLCLILLISSLRKNILPHWLSPAFWLLIPYTVINSKSFAALKSMCKYTSIIWL
ncbi:MAG: phospholipid carrier-dependent glycosyltransferase, partial [Burkholderiales bacterium]|nr:phospholipid carrier-dependent glycosyltransferase [Burkholderiales bacterium]